MTSRKGIEEKLIEVGLRIAKRGEGALFVIGKCDYQTLIEQNVPSFEVVKNPKLLESLALIDGAVIIDKKGFVKAYGVMIKSGKVFRNFGTRHSAAFSASINGNTVVLVSEEDKKIRIFKNRKIVLEIDATQRHVEESVPFIGNLLESVGAGAVGTIGAATLAPTLGLALLPGIVVFGSAYYIAKSYIHKKYKVKRK